MELEGRLKIYYFTAIFSVLFALAGFSYNAWRLELSEDNSTVRAASFELLTLLAETEQLIYAAHYDGDQQDGNPRRGWIKIGLIVDLSFLVNPAVEAQAALLKKLWRSGWQHLADDREVVNGLISQIDQVRDEIKQTLKQLE